MSTQMLTELHSGDATERAIAQRVVRIHNDRGLALADRERLVRRAQRDLLDHRAAKARRAAPRWMRRQRASSCQRGMCAPERRCARAASRWAACAAAAASLGSMPGPF